MTEGAPCPICARTDPPTIVGGTQLSLPCATCASPSYPAAPRALSSWRWRSALLLVAAGVTAWCIAGSLFLLGVEASTRLWVTS
jgi:hypothetical protein